MSELLEQQMRQLKLGGMAKEWRSIEFHDIEQYVGELLKLELHEREVNRINRMVKSAGFHVLKTLDDFVWNSCIELPVGLTQEYMTDLSFLNAKRESHFHGNRWHRQDSSCNSHCIESLSGRAQGCGSLQRHLLRICCWRKTTRAH